MGIASITPRYVRKIDPMSQEDPGKPNFIPTDGAPRGRLRASHQQGWNCKHPAGEMRRERISLFLWDTRKNRWVWGKYGRVWKAFGRWDPPPPALCRSPLSLQFPELGWSEGIKSRED